MQEYTVVIKKAYVKTFSYQVTADNADDAYDFASANLKQAYEIELTEDTPLKRNPDFDEIKVVE